MRVLVFTTVYPNTAQPVHGLFVEERARHAASEASLHVVAPVPWQVAARHPDAKRPTERRGLQVSHPVFYYLPGLFKGLDWLVLALSSFSTIRRLRRTFDFDLIDAHFGYPDGVAAILLGRWFRRPVAITLRGSELVMARFPLRRLIMRLGLPKADRIIAVSKELANLAKTLGVDIGRVHVIPNAVDVDAFAPQDRSDARKQLGIGAETRLLVSVGHVTPVKGFHRLIAALPSLLEEFPTLRLAIVGDVPVGAATYLKTLKGLVETLTLGDRVIFAGMQQREGVVRWLSAGDLFVLASDREGSPNALLEAIACGCPIVATGVADVAALVSSEVGVVVDVAADAATLATGMRQALRRSWNRESVRRSVRLRTWKTVAGEVRTVWDQTAM